MPHRIAKQIFNTLRNARRVLIIPHQNPDGDTLGSATAVAEWLFLNKIPYSIFCKTSFPTAFHYLPHARKITHDEIIWKKDQFSHIIVVDSGDLNYAGVGTYFAALNYKPILINIDHHPTNELYGDLNLVIPKASSTTEVLYHFFQYNKIPINRNLATSLMTGLLTDTSEFSNAATTKLALAIGSELIRKGADLKIIKKSTIIDKHLNVLKLWGVILARLELNVELDIVHTYLTQADLKKYKVKEEETDGIANLLNYLNEGRASLVLKEREDGNVKGSFRTTHDNLDVSVWAKSCGGGGHIKAAGFTVAGPVDVALKQIFQKIKHNELKL